MNGLASDQAIIQDLLSKGKLVVDWCLKFWMNEK